MALEVIKKARAMK